MIKKNIVFVSFDEEYVETIEYKFAKLIEEKANVEFITEPEIFERLKRMPKKIDVLIIPQEVSIEHPEIFAKSKIYYLTEKEIDGDNATCIYKYYSVKNIVQKISH